MLTSEGREEDALEDAVAAHVVLELAQLPDDLLALRQLLLLSIAEAVVDGADSRHDVGQDDWPPRVSDRALPLGQEDLTV